MAKHMYGKQTETQPCLGVKLYCTFGNKYNPTVQTTRSYVLKKEQYLIDYFKPIREAPANARGRY
jgi:hypothetical protein